MKHGRARARLERIRVDFLENGSRVNRRPRNVSKGRCFALAHPPRVKDKASGTIKSHGSTNRNCLWQRKSRRNSSLFIRPVNKSDISEKRFSEERLISYSLHLSLSRLQNAFVHVVVRAHLLFRPAHAARASASARLDKRNLCWRERAPRYTGSEVTT